MNFEGKTVLLGVTGSIAAYKAAGLASLLQKAGARVHVIMTRNALHFINPITFESLTGNKCLTDTFDRSFEFEVEHVSLAKKADVAIVAPASANVIGKLACGIADDMLTTTLMACTCKILLAPAMNTNMYRNRIVQDNLKKLADFGYEIISPATGRLACGDVGEGRLPAEELLFMYIARELACKKDMKGLKVLVTAGPTLESIDPVRFISNHSTGKMGYAIATAAMLRGAQVTLITGKTALEAPPFVRLISVVGAGDMYDAVMEHFEEQDIVIKAAAVADYRPEEVSSEKLKKKDGRMGIALVRTKDILAELGGRKSHQFLCGFSMETENLVENSQKKLRTKQADMIVANSLKEPGAGFGTDTNAVTLITASAIEKLPLMTKEETAQHILDAILRQMKF